MATLFLAWALTVFQDHNARALAAISTFSKFARNVSLRANGKVRLYGRNGGAKFPIGVDAIATSTAIFYFL